MTSDHPVFQVADLENAVWAFAALIATHRDTAADSLENALAADPDRTADSGGMRRSVPGTCSSTSS